MGGAIVVTTESTKFQDSVRETISHYGGKVVIHILVLWTGKNERSGVSS
jgi:predicted SpoU family rRNA methylase